MIKRRCAYLLLAALLPACSSYVALAPLQSGAAGTAPAQLRVDAAALPFASLAHHRFDPSDGLDIIEVAMVAVVNNPDLRVARADAALAGAQAFAAGLLPDPQLALSHDLSNTAPGNGTRAFSFGLSYDVGALLGHAALARAAGAEARKVDLNLLWQEWQVAAQAQLLFVKLSSAQKLLAVLDETVVVQRERLQRAQAALAQGAVTADAVTGAAGAWQDAQRQRADLGRQINQYAHDLNVLLGFPVGTVVRLQLSAALPAAPADPAAALQTLAQRRPDLRALEVAVGAQDARYRAALIAQFPALNLGLTRARDSSAVYSDALGLSLTLPIFNRNRGNIAIEQATRQKAAEEYKARLLAAHSEVDRLMQEQASILPQLAALERLVAELTAAQARSTQAYRAGHIDALTELGGRSVLLARQLEQISLQQAVQEQQIGLNTVLGPEGMLTPHMENRE